MVSRSLAALAAVSLAIAPATVHAQETTPTSNRPVTDDDQRNSDLFVMLGALALAALVAVLATSLGSDEPASP
jgi:hypothetical protein